MGRGGGAPGTLHPLALTPSACPCWLWLQVMGLTTSVGVLEGTNNPLFAICLVFSLIVSVRGGGGRLSAVA